MRSEHLPFATIEVIPHHRQLYDTPGDYFEHSPGVVHFRVSELPNPDFELAVLVHEILEHYEIKKKGITIEEIEKFDKEHIDHPDPGSIPGAPYHESHMWAESIERKIIDRYGHT